ncbi:MAG TPA: hypothetical protein V6C86_04295 [Oculatellaceae cyanobacterium]
MLIAEASWANAIIFSNLNLSSKTMLRYKFDTSTIGSLLLAALLLLTGIGAMAESPHSAPLLGVSSAYGADYSITVPDPSRSAKDKKSQGHSQPTTVALISKVNKMDRASGALSNSKTPARASEFSQEKLERTLDEWQKQMKMFWKAASPKVTEFYNWSLVKLGIKRDDSVSNLPAGSTHSRGTKPFLLRAVNEAHPVWLLRDGRLKTVTAH